MVHLIDDLLDVSRISTGKIHLKTEAVDLRDVVRTAADVWRPAAEAARQVLATEQDEAPVIVDGDPTRLLQVVGNLIDNAIKYSDRPGRITVSAGVREGRARLAVTDSGIGIARADQGAIFELFSQVGAARHRSDNGGLGIGLHLVRQLVELHGGSVSVHSEGERAGSTFVVQLPLRAAAIEVAEPGVAEPSRGRSPLRVLVVDDNRDAAESTAMLLMSLGYEVAAAFDGAHALEIAADWHPDLVLLDIGMPQMDGYEVARRLRTLPDLAATWIVAVSGWDPPKDDVPAAQAAFDLHLVKPLDVKDLQQLLRRVAEGARPSPPAPAEAPPVQRAVAGDR